MSLGPGEAAVEDEGHGEAEAQGPRGPLRARGRRDHRHVRPPAGPGEAAGAVPFAPAERLLALAAVRGFAFFIILNFLLIDF